MKSSTKGKQALHGTILGASTDPNFLNKVKVAPKMVKSVMKGEWGSHVKAKRKLLITLLVVVYVISPLDFFPEALFLIPGLLDDLALSTFAVATVLSLTEQYMQDETFPSMNFHATTEEPLKAKAERVPS